MSKLQVKQKTSDLKDHSEYWFDSFTYSSRVFSVHFRLWVVDTADCFLAEELGQTDTRKPEMVKQAICDPKHIPRHGLLVKAIGFVWNTETDWMSETHYWEQQHTDPTKNLHQCSCS